MQMSLSLENQPLAEMKANLEIQIERESNKELRILRSVFEQYVRRNWFGEAPYKTNWVARFHLGHVDGYLL